MFRGGRRWWGIVVSALTLGALMAVLPAPAHAGKYRVRTLIKGIEHPATFDVAPNGDIFYGERLSGEIRVYVKDRDRTRSFFRIRRVVSSLTAGTGLLAVSLDPGYPEVPYVYALATRRVSGAVRTQLVRITDDGGSGSHMTVLFRGQRAGQQHNGGKIVFGQDGMLYVVIGERDQAALAQRLRSPLGKVLRLAPDGSVPSDNPFGRRSPVYAYGIRNSFGMAVDPQTGHLWETDNGPECNDEVNRIVTGGGYGWGSSATCSTPPAPPSNTNQDGERPRLPEWWIGPPLGITGLAFCTDCGLGHRSEGAMFFGDFNRGQIHRAFLSSNRRAIAGESVILTHVRRVLSVECESGRGLFFSDPKGLYRVVPR